MTSFDITITGSDGAPGIPGFGYNNIAAAGAAGQDASCDWRSHCTSDSSPGTDGTIGANASDSAQGGGNGTDSPTVVMNIGLLTGAFAVFAKPGNGGNGGVGGNGQAGGDGGRGGDSASCPVGSCGGSNGGNGGNGGNAGNGSNGGNAGNGNVISITYVPFSPADIMISSTPVPTGGNPGGLGTPGAGGNPGQPGGYGGNPGNPATIAGNPGLAGRAAVINFTRNGK